MIGIIKVLMNGFGFIASEEAIKDVFFHANDLDGLSFDGLCVGDDLTFEIGVGDNGKTRAVNVADPNPDPDPDPELEISAIVTDFCQKLVEKITRYPQKLVEIEWRDLERVLAEVFDGLGFNTELTRSGKDGGFDIKVDFEDDSGASTVLIEVKHWMKSGKKPGEPILKAFVEVVARTESKRTSGILLSSSGFTNTIIRKRSEVELKTVRLGDSEKILSLCTHYMETKNGIWVEGTPLRDVLLSGTF